MIVMCCGYDPGCGGRAGFIDIMGWSRFLAPHTSWEEEALMSRDPLFSAAFLHACIGG